MNLELLRLLQLVSPTLPVGAFAYSQGMESAVEHKLVADEISTKEWVQGILKNNLTHLDLPVLRFQMQFFHSADIDNLQKANDLIIAFRETNEFRMESVQMAKALCRLLADLNVDLTLMPKGDLDWVTVFAFAAGSHNININEALLGYAWSWCENQIAAAIKLVPLGQTQGQRLLHQLSDVIEQQVVRSQDIEFDAIGAIAPNLAILSSQHESQYSRLFRS